MFEYKRVTLGRILKDSDFSSTLIKYSEMAPEDVEDMVVTREMSQEDISSLCAWVRPGEQGEELMRCGDKVHSDVETVLDINSKIRDSKTYFPPTIYPVGSPYGDTIDGAHRIVALASIIGTDEEIWVWELQEQDRIVGGIDERLPF
jgi:hypothetical protein